MRISRPRKSSVSLSAGGTLQTDVVGLLGQDAISGSAFRVVVFSAEPGLSESAYLGSNAVVQLGRGSLSSTFTGVVTEFGPVAANAGQTTYLARVEPRVGLLRLHSGYGIHQGATADEIFESVVDAAGLPGSSLAPVLTGSHPVLEFAMQYDESSLDFVTRLLEDEGIYFFANAAGQIVLGDSTTAYLNGPTGTYGGHLGGPSIASNRYTSLARLKRDAAGETNLMPAIVDAAKAKVTMGEMCDALREVWGVWRETPVF